MDEVYIEVYTMYSVGKHPYIECTRGHMTISSTRPQQQLFYVSRTESEQLDFSYCFCSILKLVCLVIEGTVQMLGEGG